MVCLAAQTVGAEALIVKVLEELLTVVVAAGAREVRRLEAGVVVRLVWRMAGVVEERAVRYQEREVLEQVMLLVVEGPYQTACETREVVLAASCRPVEEVLASRLYSRPEILKV